MLYIMSDVVEIMSVIVIILLGVGVLMMYVRRGKNLNLSKAGRKDGNFP